MGSFRLALVCWAIILISLLACTKVPSPSMGGAQNSQNSPAPGSSSSNNSNGSGIGGVGTGGGDPSASNTGSSSACSGLAPVASQFTVSLTFQNKARSAIVNIPPGFDNTKSAPIIFDFHGLTGSPAQEDAAFALSERGGARGYITVHPQGLNNQEGLPSWNAGACCGDPNVDDVGFFKALYVQLEKTVCFNKARVFSMGASNGGFMSYRLGCEASDLLTGIAPISGVLGIPTCAPTKPLSMLHLHGTADPLVPYNGDPALGFISVPTSVGDWVNINNCKAGPAQTLNQGTWTCQKWSQCTNNNSVTLCTVQGGGHVTPFTYDPSLPINGTDTILNFFDSL